MDGSNADDILMFLSENDIQRQIEENAVKDKQLQNAIEYKNETARELQDLRQQLATRDANDSKRRELHKKVARTIAVFIVALICFVLYSKYLNEFIVIQISNLIHDNGGTLPKALTKLVGILSSLGISVIGVVIFITKKMFDTIKKVFALIKNKWIQFISKFRAS